MTGLSQNGAQRATARSGEAYPCRRAPFWHRRTAIDGRRSESTFLRASLKFHAAARSSNLCKRRSSVKPPGALEWEVSDNRGAVETALLGPLIPLEELRPEPPLPILPHTRLELPHSRDQRLPKVPAFDTPPAWPSAAPCRALGLIHVRFQHLLYPIPGQGPKEILLPFQQGFPLQLLRAILFSGYLSFPFFAPLTEL